MVSVSDAAQADNNGYGINFDNWRNIGSDFGTGFPDDPSANHIAIIKDSEGNHLEHVDDSRTEDNLWHHVRVEVTASKVTVAVDGELVLTWQGEIDRSHSRFGFSGRTGSFNNWHLIDDVTIRTERSGPMVPGLVAWWPGDDNADDIVGGNHGTLEGGTTFAPGIVGQAFSLDGTGDYIGMGDKPGLERRSQITIDAWVKSSSGGSVVSKFNHRSGPAGEPQDDSYYQGRILHLCPDLYSPEPPCEQEDKSSNPAYQRPW